MQRRSLVALLARPIALVGGGPGPAAGAAPALACCAAASGAVRPAPSSSGAAERPPVASTSGRPPLGWGPTFAAAGAGLRGFAAAAGSSGGSGLRLHDLRDAPGAIEPVRARSAQGAGGHAWHGRGPA